MPHVPAQTDPSPRPSRRERRHGAAQPTGRSGGHALPQRPVVPARDYAFRRRG